MQDLIGLFKGATYHSHSRREAHRLRQEWGYECHPFCIAWHKHNTQKAISRAKLKAQKASEK